MWIRHKKVDVIVLYLLGFFCGIFYANFVARNYITVTGIFHEYFLNQYVQTKVVPGEYVWYLLKWRGVPFLLVTLAGLAKWKKAGASVFLLWTGFCGGIVAVAAVLRMGARGMLLCAAGIFPQFLFYIMGYAILLWYFYSYPESRWNSGKTVVVALMMGLGLWTEIYVNPGLLKWVIGKLF